MHSSLIVREDSFSWQLLGPDETKLFVRIISSKQDRDIIVFSDFIIHSAPENLIQNALEIVGREFHGPSSNMRMDFMNILPSSMSANPPKNIQQDAQNRHDQIIDQISKFGKTAGFQIVKQSMSFENGKYDSFIET